MRFNLKKIIIATHHKLAQGFKDTLNYIAPNIVEVIAINAYVDDQDLNTQIEKALECFEQSEQIFVFTDLISGSVNQEFAKYLGLYNIMLISGVNLPLILTISLGICNNELTISEINQIIVDSREQIVNVNQLINLSIMNDEDE